MTPASTTSVSYSMRRGRRSWRITRHVITIVICAVMAFPIYWMIVTALTPNSDLIAGVAGYWPRHFDIGNFTQAFAAQPWGRWFLNTVLVGVASVLLTVSTNVLAGYAFAKLAFRGKVLIFFLLLSTMMVPIQVTMVPTFRITVDLHMFGSLWGVIIPEVAAAFGIFLSRQFMMSIPNELLEAARIDGAGHVRTFLRVVLPLCKPLIAVLVLFNFMFRWNDFAWPLIILKNPADYTLPVGLLFLQGQYTVNYAQMLGMALVTILPMLVLFIALQRYFVEGLLRSGIR
ncbi:MAG TPA: carbohydrate ABC transporter permease [Streptosporangiaceae bacterium]|nr:carbohydrate ABC transporter permease [Streptosporangiaceae bacterium]